MEGKEVKTFPAPEQANDCIATASHWLIFHQVKLQNENAMAAVSDFLEESIEQFFCAATRSAHWGVCSIEFDVLRYAILDQINMFVLEEMIDSIWLHASRPPKPPKSLDKRLVCKDKFLVMIASIVQNNNYDAIAHQHNIWQLRSLIMITWAKKEDVSAA